MPAAKNGRAKGSVAEREVARLVEVWLRQEHPEARVVRTPLSGGHHAAAEFEMSGDLMVANAGKHPWCHEVKRRHNWTLGRFIDGKKSQVWGWWAQTVRDAEECGRNPVLWFRRDNQPWLVLVGIETAVRVPGEPDASWDPKALLEAGVVRAKPAYLYLSARVLAQPPSRYARL